MAESEITEIELEQLAERLSRLLLARGESVATAESCTGGWVAQTLTSIPGSSMWFERGLVTYSNESKQALLGVSAATLASSGAVSMATVSEMAAGLLAASPADWTLAISGIAGPGGSVPGKPVGYVCFAWAHRGSNPQTEDAIFPGGRRQVRARSVRHGLRGLIGRLEAT